MRSRFDTDDRSSDHDPDCQCLAAREQPVIKRVVMAVAALLSLAACAAADETLIQLSVEPKAEPVPALKYLLLPELKEMNPGNPIQSYLKCVLEERPFLFDKAQFALREKLLVMPLEALPAVTPREYGNSALALADKAARLDSPDWQILLKLKEDGVGTLLPDVQEMRPLARALQLRFRSEVAIGRFDDAITSAKTMFAMARHMDEHPTLIGNLVGIAIAHLAISPLEEMLQQPGCPNLYWALVGLPAPLITCAKGRSGERLVVSTVFKGLDSQAPMSDDQLKKLIGSIDGLLGDGNAANRGAAGRFIDERARNAAKLAAARVRLIGSGIPEPALRSFPAQQVILLDEKRDCEVRLDDVTKIESLPAWQFEALAAAAKPYIEPALFADALVAGQQTVRRRQARLEQRMALLICVEALRLYAAEHRGAFPAKLSDLSVPVPVDPITGKPFCYESSGRKAHARGTPPEPEAKNAEYRIHYEITLRE
jgi:hypothetical protein